MVNAMSGVILAVSLHEHHSFSKMNQRSIRLIAGHGVEGDAHAGATVKHRSRVSQDPNQPNLRQVHFIHGELHDELRQAGFHVSAGRMGENITTRGIDLLALPKGTCLYLGDQAVVEVTGLRNPCAQLGNYQSGLMKAVLNHDQQGNLVRKSGIMGIVLESGEIRPGDKISGTLPDQPHYSLERV